MASVVHDVPTDRRIEPAARRHGGKRWKDDADLNAAVQHVLLLISRDVHAMRECQDWSQEQLAHAAGVSAGAVLNIEKTRDDVHISTLVRIAYAAGYEVDVRFRRPARRPHHGWVNQGAIAAP